MRADTASPYPVGRPPAGPRRAARPRTWTVLLITVPLLVLILAAPAGAFVLLRPRSPAPVAQAWLDDWAKGDWPAMQALLATPKADLPATYRQVGKALGVRSATFTVGQVTRDGKRATATYAATLEL